MEENELTAAEAVAYAWRRIAAKVWSRKEFYQELKGKGIKTPQCQELVQKFEELGYLNDGRLSESVIRSESRKGKGSRLIKQKLKMRGLSPQDKQSEENSMPSDEEQTASILHLLATRYKNKDLSDIKKRRQVAASLIRRGYPCNIVFSALGQQNSS